MRWSWRNIMIGTSAAIAAMGLAVTLVVVLAGRACPRRHQSPARAGRPNCTPRSPVSR